MSMEKQTAVFEYAPAPESRAIVDIAASYGLFIDGEFVEPTGGRSFKTINPATEEVLAEVSEASAEDVDRRRQGRPSRPYPHLVADVRTRARQVPLPHRPPPAGACARARRAGVARQRQADPREPRRRRPAAAAHFFYYAGWADKLEYAGFGPGPQPLGVAGQVIPWNFPLLMLAWKIAPALAGRQHRRAQAGRDHAADRAAVRRDLPAGRPAAGRRQHRHRRRRDRPGAGRAPRRRQGRLHRLDRGRPGDRQVGRRHRQEGHPRARRQGRQHRLRRRPDRPGRRGHRQRHLLQPGPRLLRRLPAAGAGVGRRRGDGAAQAPDGDAARRRPARQEHRHRRDQLRRAAGPDPRAVRHRRGRGCRALDGAVRDPRERVLVPADGLHRRLPGPPHRPRGDLRPGAVGADLPHARRGGREGQQHAVRPVRRRLDREGLAHPVDGPAAARRRGVGQHVQQVRPDLAVRRLQGVGLRPRGRPPRPGGLPRE